MKKRKLKKRVRKLESSVDALVGVMIRSGKRLYDLTDRVQAFEDVDVLRGLVERTRQLKRKAS